MKQRKEFEKQTPKKTETNKTVQELTDQINHIIGKNPQKAAQVVEFWVKDTQKPQKKAS